MAAAGRRDVMKLPHHQQTDLCSTRARYRQGKKLTAVKVYTINDESQHLLVCGVPSLGLQDELRRLCGRFGDVKSLVYVPRYAEEEFTDVYHAQYTRIQSSRYAKRHLDGRSFYGGILHVCYMPEMESVEETRAKLIQRRKDVASRTKGDKTSMSDLKFGSGSFPKHYDRNKKHPALPITADRLAAKGASEGGPACIWKGIPIGIDPRTIHPAAESAQCSTLCGPLLPNEDWQRAGVRERLFVPHHTKRKEQTPLSATDTTSGPKWPLDSPALRFVPRQVASKRIVFHKKNDLKTSEEESKVNNNCFKRKADDLDESDPINVTVAAVREKMKAVSVPNVEVILEKNDSFRFGT
ncbi:unnamed protein product [Timema podura]|uniref:RNA-binding protein 48 n=1 Tax=Timema podura TaxID=61482 RepID=A0ABN7NEK0_TIMPD|nr:unnamed protein product [Timema podura]